MKSTVFFKPQSYQSKKQIPSQPVEITFRDQNFAQLTEIGRNMICGYRAPQCAEMVHLGGFDFVLTLNLLMVENFAKGLTMMKLIVLRTVVKVS